MTESQSNNDVDSRPVIQYDGHDTPVLIRLPDLSEPAPKPSKPPVPQSDAEVNSAKSGTSSRKGDETYRVDAGQRSNRRRSSSRPTASPETTIDRDKHRNERSDRSRRIHRSHAGRSVARSAPVSSQSELRSKLFVIGVLLAVVGITYVVLHRGGSDAEMVDEPWASSDAPAELSISGQADVVSIEPVEPGFTDLWPADDAAQEASDVTGPYAVVTPEPVSSDVSREAYGNIEAATPDWKMPLSTVSQETPAAEEDSQWPTAPDEATTTPETPISWPEADHPGWPGDPSSMQEQPAGAYPSSPDDTTRSGRASSNHYFQVPADQHMSQPAIIHGTQTRTQDDRSTARLNGNIENLRPANGNEQSSPRLY